MDSPSFINMPSQDVYFICQMVDRSLSEINFARNIEDFMGDMACLRLLSNYPKYTPLHEYIEEIVTDVIWEERDADISKLVDEHQVRWGRKLWVDHLLEAHGFQINFLQWDSKRNTLVSVEEYLEHLQHEDIMSELIERVAKEAFHILFTNRKVLQDFGTHAAYQVLEVAPDMYPEKFSNKGHLYRARIPQWVKNAIFHRDKGMCVQCRVDLTRLVNQQNALHYDHIIPLAKGGMNDITNLQLLCAKCNQSKSDNLSSVKIYYESWYQY